MFIAQRLLFYRSGDAIVLGYVSVKVNMKTKLTIYFLKHISALIVNDSSVRVIPIFLDLL